MIGVPYVGDGREELRVLDVEMKPFSDLPSGEVAELNLPEGEFSFGNTSVLRRVSVIDLARFQALEESFLLLRIHRELFHVLLPIEVFAIADRGTRTLGSVLDSASQGIIQANP